MKILMVARATLYTEAGGDTIHIINTAAQLRKLGAAVDIVLTNAIKDYSGYDLLHFFNITRPADIILHIRLSKKPYVITPIFVEYGEFDKYFRKGIAGKLFRLLNPHTIEYLKVIARSIYSSEKIMSPEYLWLGQKKSIRRILNKASFLLPNSYNEITRLKRQFQLRSSYAIIANGIDEAIFNGADSLEKDALLVLCVARIEGIKNQLNLIKALNGSRFRLLLIGKPAQHQTDYWKACKAAAADNIFFIDNLPQQDLIPYYKKAKVHILPSWFETTGLSSLEAAAMGCNIVITDRGDAKEYFGKDAWYCDPASPASMLKAVEEAAGSSYTKNLRTKIFEQYTWKTAAIQTLNAYNETLKISK